MVVLRKKYSEALQIRVETPYKNGERNGVEKKYYNNGYLKMKHYI